MFLTASLSVLKPYPIKSYWIFPFVIRGRGVHEVDMSTQRGSFLGLTYSLFDCVYIGPGNSKPLNPFDYPLVLSGIEALTNLTDWQSISAKNRRKGQIGLCLSGNWNPVFSYQGGDDFPQEKGFLLDAEVKLGEILEKMEVKPKPDSSNRGTFGGSEKTLPPDISKKQSPKRKQFPICRKPFYTVAV